MSFDDISRQFKDQRCDYIKRDEPEEERVCPNCESGGWGYYCIGRNDPHFRVCEECDNPDNLPSP